MKPGDIRPIGYCYTCSKTAETTWRSYSGTGSLRYFCHACLEAGNLKNRLLSVGWTSLWPLPEVKLEPVSAYYEAITNSRGE